MEPKILLLFFDLPMESVEERRAYSRFRKRLIRSGYLMLQESVYVRLLRHGDNLPSEIAQMEETLPEGNIRLLSLSLRQFSGMWTLRGEPFPLDALTADFLTV